MLVKLQIFTILVLVVIVILIVKSVKASSRFVIYEKYIYSKYLLYSCYNEYITPQDLAKLSGDEL